MASLFLATEVARTVVHHEASIIGMMPIPQGRTEAAVRVQLFTAAEPSGPGICRRDSHFVVAERDQPSGLDLKSKNPPVRYAQIRLDDDCDGADRRRFATLDREISEIEASPLLRRIGELRDDASAGRSLNVQIECISDLTHYVCPSDTRFVLMNLPLEGAYLIGRDRGASREPYIAATETEPGQAYWDVRLSEGPQPVLRLKRSIPPPF